MKRALLVLALASLALPAAASAHATRVTTVATGDTVTLTNGLISRTWSRSAFQTRSLRDERDDTVWSRDTPDFTLTLGAATIDSTQFSLASTQTTRLPDGGERLVMELSGIPTLRVQRIAELHPGVAGVRMQTVLTPTTPLALSAVTLEQAAPPRPVAPTLQAFRAGSDWRDPEYTGPQYGVGDQPSLRSRLNQPLR